MLKEFRAFILRGNVIDLAVGIIIGAAFTSIVNSLVNDIIMPLIGLVLGKATDFNNYFVVIGAPAGYVPTSVAAARTAGYAVFAYGAFITAVINFLIIAFVVFIMVRAMNRLMERFAKEKAAEAPAPTVDQTLLTEIRDLLKAQNK
jgi:large conductance mechanosensitive channel